MGHRFITESANKWQEPELPADVPGQPSERLSRFRLQIDDTLFKLAHSCQGELKGSCASNQSFKRVDDVFSEIRRLGEWKHEGDMRRYARCGAGVELHPYVLHQLTRIKRRH